MDDVYALKEERTKCSLMHGGWRYGSFFVHGKLVGRPADVSMAISTDLIAFTSRAAEF